MKFVSVLSLLSIYLLTLENASSQTPVYFNIISHNEITDPLDYAHSEADYQTIRSLVKELCDTINSKKAKYNMQVDANMIFGCLKYDDGANNPNDLLEWASNSEYIDVDGHNHFSPFSNPYNYSDLAYLLDSCGVTLHHHVLGGVAYANLTIAGKTFKETWTQYINPKKGYTFKDFAWQADIVWGTATPGHQADYTSFGLWRPKGGSSPAEFGTHDPNQRLVTIGGGCKGDIGFNIIPQTKKIRNTTGQIISKIKEIVDNIQGLPKSSNDFYTMNLLINFRDIPEIPYFADSIGRIIDGLSSYTEQGKIVWMTLGEKYDLWMELHPDREDYFNLLCEDITLTANNISITSQLNLYPNPAHDAIHIEGDYPPNTYISIFSLEGRRIKFQILQEEISLSDLAAGTYIFQIKTEEKTYRAKVVKL